MTGSSANSGGLGWVAVAGGKDRRKASTARRRSQIHLAREHETSVWRNATRKFGCCMLLVCVSVSGQIACDRLFFVPLSGRRATQIDSVSSARHSKVVIDDQFLLCPIRAYELIIHSPIPHAREHLQHCGHCVMGHGLTCHITIQQKSTISTSLTAIWGARFH